ncbi:MAG: cache domain-containing protein [Defluviitaleaceae bacterium]|nr:cache domain-containing protein [Defluviitaleaceae bacterium]
MPGQKQRDVVAPILMLIMLGMVILAVISGITSYFSVYNESINALRQQNRALINRLDGWISTKASIVESNAMLIRDSDISHDSVIMHFANILDANDHISDVYIGFPDGSGYFGAEVTMPPGWVSYRRPWYLAAAENPGTVVFTQPYLELALNQLAFASVRTVSDYDDSLGVVGLDVPFYILAHYVELENALAGSFSVIICPKGNILMHPNLALSPVDEHTFNNKTEIFGGRYVDMFAAIGRDGFYAGDGVVYVGAPLATTGWFVITRTPTPVIMSNVFPTLMGIAATVLVAVVCMAGAGLSLSKAQAARKKEQQASGLANAVLENSPLFIEILDENLRWCRCKRLRCMPARRRFCSLPIAAQPPLHIPGLRQQQGSDRAVAA